jgi:hypothetical protein
MLNPFLLNGSKSEQGMLQDLINESLRMYGIDVYYLPRQFVNEKSIIKEVVESEFNTAFPIEAYVESYDGYSGQGTILSKFGIQELDDLTLTISKERYENYIQNLIHKIPNSKLTSRPKEGDLIYFPLGDRLFEIKYVEHEKPFYQLQKNYVYQLTCELFRYEDEVIDTDIDIIDDNVQDYGYIQTLNMIGAGVTATATTTVVNGGVRSVTITNRGSGYTSAPIVKFSSPPSGGIRATGIAEMISGIVDFCESNPNLLRVQKILITNPGSGYVSAPQISFVGGEGSGVEATAVIGDGIIGPITVTEPGSGYLTQPTITFTGISTVSAAATAVLSNGTVSSIQITNAGLGYNSAPDIEISAPNTSSGTGTFKFNEIVTGSVSGTTGRVKYWNITSNILEVSNITGDFKVGETITGSESSASYVLRKINTDNLPDSESLNNSNTGDKFADNLEIETEADLILDFSEKNPFGTP